METKEKQILMTEDVINNGGAIFGNITFVDESYEDFNSLKDSYCIEPEICVFCIINSVVNVLHYISTDDLSYQCEDALQEAESYLIPSQYTGKIIIDIN